MKLPRDLSGSTLVKALTKLGYVITRQTGSHIRLTTQQNGEHHLTIPAHDPIKRMFEKLLEVKNYANRLTIIRIMAR